MIGAGTRGAVAVMLSSVGSPSIVGGASGREGRGAIFAAPGDRGVMGALGGGSDSRVGGPWTSSSPRVLLTVRTSLFESLFFAGSFFASSGFATSIFAASAAFAAIGLIAGVTGPVAVADGEDGMRGRKGFVGGGGSLSDDTALSPAAGLGTKAGIGLEIGDGVDPGGFGAFAIIVRS